MLHSTEGTLTSKGTLTGGGGRVKMHQIMLLLAVFSLFSCSQKADIEVVNKSGNDLEGTIEGASFYLDAWETASKEIDIGAKFIFGPDEKTVVVRGEGPCVRPFSERVTVADEELGQVIVHGDAGLITVENYRGYYIDVEIDACTGGGWGAGSVAPGYYITWRAPIGCYDIYFSANGVLIASDSDYLDLCTEITYTFSVGLSGQIMALKSKGKEEAFDISGSIAATPQKERNHPRESASPDNRTYEEIAASKRAPNSSK